jgi:hypothetical protein
MEGGMQPYAAIVGGRRGFNDTIGLDELGCAGVCTVYLFFYPL